MVTVALLVGIIAALVFLGAAVAPFWWAPVGQGGSRLNLIAWGAFFLTLYFLLGGGALVVTR